MDDVQVNALPVCTLFNEENDANSGDGDAFNVGPCQPEKNLSHTTSDSANALATSIPPTSPTVCNIFQVTSSSEDPFQELVIPSTKIGEVVKNTGLLKATFCETHSVHTSNPSDTLTSVKVLEVENNVTSLSVQLAEKEIDTGLDAPVKSRVSSEDSNMMTSIRIQEGDSMENIANISMQSSVEERSAPDKDVNRSNDTSESDSRVNGSSATLGPYNSLHNVQTQQSEDCDQHETVNSPLCVDGATPGSKVSDGICTGNQNSKVGLVEEAPLASALFSTASEGHDQFSKLCEGNKPSSPTDAFTHAITSSVSDRRKDAWIPSESTQMVLTAIAQSQSRIKLDENHLVRPGLGTCELLGDPIKSALTRCKGSEGISRETPSVDSVSPDEQGLKKLIDTGNLRSAVDLCGKVLTGLGQGFGQQTQESTNSPMTLQWWSVRLSLLIRLKLYDLAETEISPFGDFDSADLFYGFYPDVYPGRQGCMVPFSLRLLYAELPRHVNKSVEAIARLYNLLTCCDKIIENLHSGKTEIGTVTDLQPDDKDASIALWTNRKIKVLYALGNSLVQLKEFEAAIKTYEDIIAFRPSDFVPLQSGIGRALLQVGDIKSAQQRFAEVEKAAGNSQKHRLQLLINRGLLYLGANKWDDALTQFSQAAEIDPRNLEAQNNKAVCLLYLCRLKEAIGTLENALNFVPTEKSEDVVPPFQIPFEAALNNLVTLYELESTRSFQKKLMLLQRLALTAGDGFDTTCLKL